MSAVNHAKIAAPGAIVDGKSIAQWSQNWLRWLMTADKDHPVGEPFSLATPASDALNADVNQSGPVFFLYGGNWGTPNPTAATVGTEPVINVPFGKDILVPLVNVFDLEDGNPKNSTIADWVAETHLSFADEARIVPFLASLNVTDAHLTVATKADPTHPFINLQWPVSAFFAANSGLFSLGGLSPNSYLGNLGFPDIPFADVAGRWAMLTNLSKGDYVINFGGHSNATVDPFSPTHSVIQALPDITFNTTDVLHVA
jgi:hypothetical protein